MLEKGIKFDQGKLLWNLVPWKEMEGVVRVLMGGAKKYSPDNWKYVDPERYKDAILRHVIAYLGGEIIDPDSGEHHMSHVICNALFIAWHDKSILVYAPVPEPKPFDWDKCVTNANDRVMEDFNEATV